MKVTLITASYNSAITIDSCVQSVLEQDYDDIEYIIVDGASTDNTQEILKQKQKENAIIQFISEPDKGIYDALNKGISMSSGEIIGFVHSDDFLAHPRIISNIVAQFKNGNYTGVYGNLLYVNRKNTNRVIRNWYSKTFNIELLERGWMPAHPTLFLKKEVYRDCGNFDKSYKISADYDFMLRILRKPDYTFGFLPQVITKMRMGGESNKKIANILKKSQEDFRAMKANELKNPLAALFLKNVSKLKQFI